LIRGGFLIPVSSLRAWRWLAFGLRSDSAVMRTQTSEETGTTPQRAWERGDLARLTHTVKIVAPTESRRIIRGAEGRQR